MPMNAVSSNNIRTTELLWEMPIPNKQAKAAPLSSLFSTQQNNGNVTGDYETTKLMDYILI